MNWMALAIVIACIAGGCRPSLPTTVVSAHNPGTAETVGFIARVGADTSPWSGTGEPGVF